MIPPRNSYNWNQTPLGLLMDLTGCQLRAWEVLFDGTLSTLPNSLGVDISGNKNGPSAGVSQAS